MEHHEIELTASRLRKLYGGGGSAIVFFGSFLVPEADPLENASTVFEDIRRSFDLSDDDVLALHGDDILRITDIVSTVGSVAAQSDFARRHAKAFMDKVTKDDRRHERAKGFL